MTRPYSAGALSNHTTLTSGMYTRTRNLALAALAVAAGFVLPSCSSTVSGIPVAIPPPPAVIEPTFPPGLTIITEPLPAETPLSSYKLPTSAEEAVARVVAFWNGSPYDMGLHVNVEAAQAPLVCETKVFRTSPAAQCAGGTILYDSAWAQRALADSPYGPVAVAVVMAHEVGHAIQGAFGAGGQLTDATGVGGASAAEMSADCYGGMYMATTGLSTAAMDAAVASTPMGVPARVQAFHDGLGTTDPNVCIDRYLN